MVFVNAGRLGFDYEERFLVGAGAALVAVALLIEQERRPEADGSAVATSSQCSTATPTTNRTA